MNIREIIQKIIDKFREPKPKLLTEGKQDIIQDKSAEFRQGQKCEIPDNGLNQKETLEDIILEYINQYEKQIETETKDDISYKAFTRMFYSKREDVGENVENQEKLKDKITKNSRYRLDGQYSSKGKPIFYHISQNTDESENITDKDENMQKIYLNCERKDIARLTGEILKKLDKIDDCAFRMKFLAESDESEVSKRYERNDKIVIYVANDIDKERIINSIIDLKNKEPELFSDKKRLPLMPKINGFIGCITQGKNIVSTPLRESVYADTYNSKLAKIMEDCMISSLREISARDPKMVYAMDGYFGEDAKEYLKAYKMMNPEQIRQVVEMFKTELIYSCQKSNLDIDKKQEMPNQQR